MVLTSALVGCDESSEFEACVYAADPEASSGARRDQCPPSTFPVEQGRSREVGGVVRRGADVVPGALVRVEPWAGFPSAKSSREIATTVTDAAGTFALRPVSLRYDLFTRFGPDAEGRDDVMVHQAVGGRYVEPTLEAETYAFPRSWTGRLDVRLEPPPPEGHAVLFFASGEGVYGVSGDRTTGLRVHGRAYVTPATIHAIEYDKAAGLETATAYGKIDVRSDAGAVQLTTIRLESIQRFTKLSFDVRPPAGLPVPSAVDVFIVFTPTSYARLGSVPAGKAATLPIVPNGGYTYRARTEVEGAVSDSGETGFDICTSTVKATPPAPDLCVAETKIDLPALPVVVAPREGEPLATGAPLVATGKGVFEHVLVPEDGGPRMRVITRYEEAPLPDVERLGAAPAKGAYRWTVRNFPTATYAEDLSGIDTRRYRKMSAGKPRTIVLR